MSAVDAEGRRDQGRRRGMLDRRLVVIDAGGVRLVGNGVGGIGIYDKY